MPKFFALLFLFLFACFGNDSCQTDVNEEVSMIFSGAFVKDYGDDSCAMKKEVSITFSDTVVKGYWDNCRFHPYALCRQTIRKIVFYSNPAYSDSSICKTIIGIDDRIILQFLEPLTIENGIYPEQVNLAVKNPEKIVSSIVVKESFGGLGWLFKKQEKRGVIYKNQSLEKTVSFIQDKTESFLSWEMLSLIVLIVILSFFVGLMLNTPGEKKYWRHFKTIAMLALSFSLISKLKIWNETLESNIMLAASITLSLVIALAIYIFSNFPNEKYSKLCLPVWGTLELCTLIGFFAGIYSFLFYLTVAWVIFIIVCSFPAIKKLCRKTPANT